LKVFKRHVLHRVDNGGIVGSLADDERFCFFFFFSSISYIIECEYISRLFGGQGTGEDLRSHRTRSDSLRFSFLCV